MGVPHPEAEELIDDAVDKTLVLETEAKLSEANVAVVESEIVESLGLGLSDVYAVWLDEVPEEDML